MILIKITQENREPKVGEWYYNKLGYSGYSAIRTDRYGAYVNCKALSLSVILDAPEKPDRNTESYEKNSSDREIILEVLKSYPISNSEEIFQWLHDNGKLGEEWVEFEGAYSTPNDGSIILHIPNKVTRFAIDMSEDKQDMELLLTFAKYLNEFGSLKTDPNKEVEAFLKSSHYTRFAH